MARSLPRVLLAGRSRRQRLRNRAGIRLRDFSITAKTRARYEAAVARLLPFMEAQPSLDDLDGILCDWIELQWTRGEPLGYIADALSGLHHYWPELKGRLREAWRLFKSWRRIEVPTRAPPITPLLVRAFISKAFDDNNLSFGVLLAVGFHCLLRTGELLSLRFADIELSPHCAVLSLKASKSGLRSGTMEAVAVRDPLTLQLLDTLIAVTRPSPGQLLWPHSGQAFREYFRKLCSFFRVAHLSFKPYSLRRGGATFLLQEGVALEAILLRGRWKSVAVARLYLQDALALIPSMRIAPADLPRVNSFANTTSPTAFRP